MTKHEFQNQMIHRINHATDGEAFLYTGSDKDEVKSAGYRNREGNSSFGASGKTWDEVYEFMTNSMKDNIHILPFENE